MIKHGKLTIRDVLRLQSTAAFTLLPTIGSQALLHDAVMMLRLETHDLTWVDVATP